MPVQKKLLNIFSYFFTLQSLHIKIVHRVNSRSSKILIYLVSVIKVTIWSRYEQSPMFSFFFGLFKFNHVLRETEHACNNQRQQNCHSLHVDHSVTTE